MSHIGLLSWGVLASVAATQVHRHVALGAAYAALLIVPLGLSSTGQLLRLGVGVGLVLVVPTAIRTGPGGRRKVGLRAAGYLVLGASFALSARFAPLEWAFAVPATALVLLAQSNGHAPWWRQVCLGFLVWRLLARFEAPDVSLSAYAIGVAAGAAWLLYEWLSDTHRARLRDGSFGLAAALTVAAAAVH